MYKYFYIFETQQTNQLTNPGITLKRIIFIVMGLWTFLFISLSQNITITGIPNSYLRVDEVQADRVKVTDVTGGQLTQFQSENKVLLIQITGGTLLTDPGFERDWNRTKKSFNHAGTFEILQVEQINVINDTVAWVVFTDNIARTYDAGEKIQLVRFVEGETVTTSGPGPVTAMAWNGKVGGILAIIGTDSVKLNQDIDVSAKGFRGGAVPAENYTGGCRYSVSLTILDTLYFYPYEINRSGNKGEGIITTLWPYTKGTGFALNGGGAGNGKYSGGGGGSNHNQGGDGGKESPSCNLSFPVLGGWGGYGCYDLYSYANRQIIMGGGGGSGTKLSTSTPSRGGIGGGIVIILTGTLAGNGKSIISKGEDASSTTGSGGGGGAGGTVLIDATDYSGSLLINVKGGKGGNTTDAANCTGSGGGGSGGVLWYSGTSIPATVDAANGASGSVAGSCSSVFGLPGKPGTVGVQLSDLIPPLTGFLFNSIRGTDTVCAGQIPHVITASQPKGGDNTYIYTWEQSANNINWDDAAGTTIELKRLQPPALTQTTFYRRVVTSDGIFDTSRVIKVYVYPAITGNSITGTDTICYNTHAKNITGTAPAGGNGVYQYLWQYSTDQATWITGGTTNPHDPGVLQQSRYYRRVVTSTKYCSGTSNPVRVTVLPLITRNAFETGDTVICENQGPGLLNAKTPGGGDGNYAYQWQNRSLTGNWTNISATNLRYNPGTLTDTTFYRRIVYSGNDRACKDTSQAKAIDVLPALSNNLLTSASDRYCAGDIPERITGEQPAGGDGTYHYQWRIHSTGNWQYITGAGNINFSPVQQVESNTWFSRVVTSGANNVCHDTSSAFALIVVPYIINNLGVADQTICQFNTPASLAAVPAGGGLGGLTYMWIKLEDGATEWTNATGTNNLATYSPGALTATTLFARKAFSDICSDTSDAVSITVYPVISNNSILGSSVQYTCFNTPITLPGSQPDDGNGTYAYQWEQSSNNSVWTQVFFGAGTDQDYISGNLIARQYFRRNVYSSSLSHECTDVSDIVEVRINPLPTGDVIDDLDTLCQGGTVYVKFNLSGNGPFNVAVGGLSNQTKTGITLSPDSIAFNPSSTGQFTMYSIEDDSGCFADVSGFTQASRVVVYEVPDARPGNNEDICSNTYKLKASKSVTGSSGLWTGTGVTFSDLTDANSNITADDFGTKVLTWTETNWHCTNAKTVEITFYEQPPAPDAGPDQSLDFSYTAQLQAVPVVVGSGKWTIVSGEGDFDNDTIPDAVISELANAATLKWTVTNGNCQAVSDNMEILVNPLVIKKGFTPNGDTKNDVFDIGAVHAELIKIKIFNSAGILVYESDNYQEDNFWDGRNMNSVELPEGTYYYLIDMKVAGKQDEVHFRSFVEILR